ncbi:MAG: hypothetical protein ACOC80_11355 [Petrotogales bacterium]
MAKVKKTIVIDADLHKRIKKKSVDLEMSFSSLVEAILIKYEKTLTTN